MATFEAQVEALTGIAIDSSGTNPTQAELSQFLRDGVLDVTSKWIAGHTQDRDLFMRASSAIENNGDFDLKGASIISVIREAGADGSSDGSTAWEPCRRISSNMQSRVVDTDSLSFASKYNPVYTIVDFNEVHVYPTPDGTNDSFKVFYVNHVPKDLTNSADLAYTHSDIKYFPADKVYLVTLYAALQSLQAAMANSIVSISTVVPVAPTVSSVTTVSFSQSPPVFVPPSLSQVTTYIDTNQDVELASAKLQEVNATMQNSLNTFNQQNTEYQAQLQIAVENAKQDGNEDAQKLQKYQGEVTLYQAEVQKEVQESTTKTQQYQGLYMQLAQQYNSVFQVAQPQQQGGR